MTICPGGWGWEAIVTVLEVWSSFLLFLVHMTLGDVETAAGEWREDRTRKVVKKTKQN